MNTEAPVRIRINWGKQLLYKVTCPNCWHRFPPEDMLYVAQHPDLVGDAVLGKNDMLRFLPTRFRVSGEAVDPRGASTGEMACPRCHLPVYEANLEDPPLFISLIGSPASGKSYFLATMVHELRALMPRLRVGFTDAHPAANSVLNGYEVTLFRNPQPDRSTEIAKTTTDAVGLHRYAVLEGGVTTRLPVPFQFSLYPLPTHPNFAEARAKDLRKTMVLYDNAGEDFRPGVEARETTVVHHMATSKILFMLLDLAQEPQFRAVTKSSDPQIRRSLRPKGQQAALDSQETILRMASLLLRKYLGFSESTRLKKPLIVIVPKYDIWEPLVGISIDKEPYETLRDGRMVMNTAVVDKASAAIRHLLERYCPQFVAAADALCHKVRFIPVSSLGGSPTYIETPERAFYGIRPKDIKPKWVTVPLTYCLCKWLPGMIDDRSKGKH